MTRDDYEDHGLSPLLIECAKGRTEDLNYYVFKCIDKRITAWPLGGKPLLKTASECFIPRASITPSKILIFSPHPDDDVISMGATIKKLVTQGHHISIVYMTGGSNGVHDHEAQKFLYFLKGFNNL